MSQHPCNAEDLDVELTRGHDNEDCRLQAGRGDKDKAGSCLWGLFSALEMGRKGWQVGKGFPAPVSAASRTCSHERRGWREKSWINISVRMLAEDRAEVMDGCRSCVAKSLLGASAQRRCARGGGECRSGGR